MMTRVTIIKLTLEKILIEETFCFWVGMLLRLNSKHLSFVDWDKVVFYLLIVAHGEVKDGQAILAHLTLLPPLTLRVRDNPGHLNRKYEISFLGQILDTFSGGRKLCTHGFQAMQDKIEVAISRSP